jgi:predicted metal-binding protein
MRDVTDQAPVELLVCTTCRRGLPVEDDAQRPGALLHAALSHAELPDGVHLKAVECLSNCDQGCSVVLRGGPARWTFVYENLNETDDIDVIVEGATKYHATENGIVPWRERPVHFRKNCAARIPPLGA